MTTNGASDRALATTNITAIRAIRTLARMSARFFMPRITAISTYQPDDRRAVSVEPHFVVQAFVT
jgi:hypothetical protein